MKRSALLRLVALVLIMAPPTISRDTTGTVEGVVVGLDQKPIQGSRVTIQESGNGEHPHATLTDVNGKFAFQRFLPGAYDLRAYFLGVWSPWEKNVRLQAGRSASVTLRIPASPSKDLPVQSPPTTDSSQKP